MTRLVFNRDGGKTDEFGHLLALNRLFQGEVITGMQVTQAGSPNLTVQVSTGVASIPKGSGATAYSYYVGTDAIEVVTITTANGSNPRRDYIVAYVDTSVTPSTGVTNNSNNMFKIISVAGVPAAVPADPTVSAIQTAIGSASYPYIILARVRVSTADTAITNNEIDNLQNQVTLAVPASANDGWSAADTATYGANNGSKEQTVTIVGDKTTRYWPGQKVKFTRGVAPPTQCADFESSSNQYASRTSASVTGMTFTDDFTIEAWINPESYTAVPGMIASRINSAVTQGWIFQFSQAGQAVLTGYTTAGGTARAVKGLPAAPLGKWTHVAASLDMSAGTGVVYMNGTAVASIVSGTATGLIQAGDLMVGEYTFNDQPFDGKIADVRVWNTVRTASQIRDNMNQQLVGNESGLVSYYKLNGNFNDSTSNANNLTAQNSASALTSDNPMKPVEYGIITNVTYTNPNTTLTIYTGNNYNIPNMLLTNMYYSGVRIPYGFPAARGNWRSETIVLEEVVIAASTGYTNFKGLYLSVPTGDFEVGYSITTGTDRSGAGGTDSSITLSTTSSSESDSRLTRGQSTASAGVFSASTLAANALVTTAAITPYYINGSARLSGMQNMYLFGGTTTRGGVTAYAECAYI